MRFAEVLDIRNGRNQRQVENENGKYPIYGSGGIMGRADDFLCEAETVVIGRKGSINNPIYVDEPFWNVDTAFGLVAHKDVLLPKYLYYFCVNFDFEKLNTTVTIPSLTKANLLQIEISVPDMDKQRYIVGVLDRICHLIELRQRELRELDQLVKSRFIELFDGKHETKPLQAVCEELFAGGDVKKDKSSDTQSEEYPYPIYTNGEKDNGLYGYTSIVRVAKEAVTISGRGTIGFTCLRKEPFYPAVRLIVAVPKQELVNGCYLQHFIQSKNYGGQGASIPQLTVPMIKDEPIPVPPMELQKQFTAFVEQTDKSKYYSSLSFHSCQQAASNYRQEWMTCRTSNS